MSISFSCDSCGKSFTVDDKFAGKKGKCKQCGATMQIPNGATPQPAPSSAPASRGVDREISPSRRTPGPPPAPKADLFGFDDEPAARRSAVVADDDIEPL